MPHGGRPAHCADVGAVAAEVDDAGGPGVVDVGAFGGTDVDVVHVVDPEAPKKPPLENFLEIYRSGPSKTARLSQASWLPVTIPLASGLQPKVFQLYDWGLERS